MEKCERGFLPLKQGNSRILGICHDSENKHHSLILHAYSDSYRITDVAWYIIGVNIADLQNPVSAKTFWNNLFVK